MTSTSDSYGKSPLTSETMGALQVWANGMTLENYRNMVAGSYGISTPGVIGSISELQHSAVVILKEGGMFLGIVMDLVSEIPNSYGNTPSTIREGNDCAYRVLTDGILLENYGVMTSYGCKNSAASGK